MASSTQKLNETGWFYHAPSKPLYKPEIEGPPISQIPGLSDLPAEGPQPSPIRGMIKDSDSKYVRLAKQGGRPDLLRFRSPKPVADKAQNYPRVDWYYLEDNAAEAAEQHEQEQNAYQSMMPDYMVHDTYTPSFQEDNKKYVPKRAPFGFDQTTAFERDGHTATDKTVRLPEHKHAGYGIRAEKLKNTPVKHTYGKPEKGKAPVGELEEDRKFPTMHLPDEGLAPEMGKILSWGYGKEWTETRDAQISPAKHSNKKVGFPGNQEKQTTGGRRPTSVPKSEKSVRTTHSEKSRRKDQEDAKELFKMSKFKNVAAKTDSHRHQ